MDKFRKRYLKTVFLTGITLVLLFGTYMYSVMAQKSISEKVIRLHVIADSDSRRDQEIKLRVRDEILNSIGREISDAENRDEALKILEGKLSEIECASENVIKSEGLNYPVRAKLTKEIFPEKSYGVFCFPAGSYTALKVSIGKAEGKNWWCVMFPPLCLTEETLSDEGYEILNKALSESDMEIIDRSENRKKPVSDIKFFIVEKWHELLG